MKKVDCVVNLKSWLKKIAKSGDEWIMRDQLFRNIKLSQSSQIYHVTNHMTS